MHMPFCNILTVEVAGRKNGNDNLLLRIFSNHNHYNAT